jgi:hypothetical protein
MLSRLSRAVIMRGVPTNNDGSVFLYEPLVQEVLAYIFLARRFPIEKRTTMAVNREFVWVREEPS